MHNYFENVNLATQLMCRSKRNEMMHDTPPCISQTATSHHSSRESFDNEVDFGIENHWTPSPSRGKTCTLGLVCAVFQNFGCSHNHNCFTTSF
jgi:hypothetical protein